MEIFFGAVVMGLFILYAIKKGGSGKKAHRRYDDDRYWADRDGDDDGGGDSGGGDD